MIRVLRRLAGVALAATLGAATAAAQQTVPNPHGDLRLECATCHSAKGWTPVRVARSFRHADGRFPLAGAHAQVACQACHKTLDFKGVSTSCVSCHRDVHRGELGTDCARCHTARSFIDRAAMVRFHQTTRFPLTGAHLVADCEQCHTPSAEGQLTFVNRATTCDACHMPAYQATTNPPHAAGGFPTTCEVCHATVAWTRARFDHSATQFPLTGAHRAVACNQCHGDGVYKGKSTACVSCHQKDYDGTTDPAHGPAGFPTACATCHNTTAWSGATFDHSTTAFPLTGAHKTVACNQCHGDGVYKGKSTACVSCHLTDYNGTTDPAHAGAGFPTTCEQCHTTTTWSGATFNHDGSFFPIYSGTHAGLWSSCTTCHTNTASYAQFTCFNCHEHDQSTTDSHHTGVSGYTYNSQACYSCHPQGRSP